MKSTKLFLLIFLLFLMGCSPSPEKAAQDACGCLSTVLEKDFISEHDVKTCYDSCENILKTKYAKQIQDDKWMQKLAEYEGKLKIIEDKIIEKYKSQIFSLDLFDFIKKYNAYNEGSDMIDLNIKITGLLLFNGIDNNGDFILQLIPVQEKNGLRYIMFDDSGEPANDKNYYIQIAGDLVSDALNAGFEIEWKDEIDQKNNGDDRLFSGIAYFKQFIKPLNSNITGDYAKVKCFFKDKPKEQLIPINSQPDSISIFKSPSSYVANEYRFYNYSFKQLVEIQGTLKEMYKRGNGAFLALDNCELISVKPFD